MKKINLQLIIDKDKTAVRTEQTTYRIFLNWGITNSFSNRKKAGIFQTRINTWINEIFFEMNLIYASLLFNFRTSWLVIDRDTEVKIMRTFTQIDDNFNKLYKSDYRGTDGSFYAFAAIDLLCNDLTYCLKLLIIWRREKNDWEQIKELELLIRQLNRIKSEVTEKCDPMELGRKIRRKD